MTKNAILTPEKLLYAYSIGVFPMSDSRDDENIFWVRPQQRGIIPLNRFHIPKRLKKEIHQAEYDIKVNYAFEKTIEECALNFKKNRENTWINHTIQKIYIELHHQGHAHSVEVWKNNKMLGGLYGVHLGSAFFGESMFSKADNVSKIALVYLVARLKYAKFTLLDTQFITQHLKQFGAIETKSQHYDGLLQDALQYEVYFMAMPQTLLPQDITQLASQTL
jgi:leucyl/phenylalanyl-tRNA--protein transferase